MANSWVLCSCAIATAIVAIETIDIIFPDNRLDAEAKASRANKFAC